MFNSSQSEPPRKKKKKAIISHTPGKPKMEKREGSWGSSLVQPCELATGTEEPRRRRGGPQWKEEKNQKNSIRSLIISGRARRLASYAC